MKNKKEGENDMNYVSQNSHVFVVPAGTKLAKTKILKENKERSDFIRNLIKNSKNKDNSIEFELEVTDSEK